MELLAVNTTGAAKDTSVHNVRFIVGLVIEIHDTGLYLSYTREVEILKHLPIFPEVLNGKQKSPWRAKSRSRSQPLKPGGREKVTQITLTYA